MKYRDGGIKEESRQVIKEKGSIEKVSYRISQHPDIFCYGTVL